MYNDGALAIFALLGAFIVFFIAIGVILYILKSIGLYKLASNAGIDNAWLAWIPIADAYIIAKLAGEVHIGSFLVPNNEIILPISTLIFYFASDARVIGPIICIAYAILFFFTLHKLYKNYRPDSAVLWIVLSIVLLFMSPIFLFVMRNDDPVLKV